jgi:hypothetical protein
MTKTARLICLYVNVMQISLFFIGAVSKNAGLLIRLCRGIRPAIGKARGFALEKGETGVIVCWS